MKLKRVQAARCRPRQPPGRTALQILKTMSKMSLFKEIWLYMRQNKKYWLVPILFILILMSVLLIVAQSSALAPFIYSIF